MPTFGEQVKKRGFEMNLTQEQLAAKAKLGTKTIQRIEKDLPGITRQSKAAVAAVLGIPYDPDKDVDAPVRRGPNITADPTVDPYHSTNRSWNTVDRQLKLKVHELAQRDHDKDLNELIASMVAAYETESILSGATLKLIVDASRGTGKTPDQLVRGWIDEHKKKDRINTARDIAAEVTGRKRKSA